MTAPDTERRPVDLDRVQENLVALVGFTFLVIGTIGGALLIGSTFGAWAGFLPPTIVGGVMTVYSLRKAAERRTAAEQHLRYLESQERTTTVTLPSPPRLP